MTQLLYESLAKRAVFWISMIVGALAALAFGGLLLFRTHYMETASTQLQDMVETRHTYAEFRTALGYGGFIHNFKNYVLRGQEDYLKRANNQMHQVALLWAAMKTRIPGFYTEKDDISTMLGNYADALVIANTHRREGAEALDHLVKVDDIPALRAMKILSDYITRQIETATTTLHRTEVKLDLWLQFAGFLLMLSIFIGYLNRSIRLERAEIADREQEIRRRVKELTAHKTMLELQQNQAEQLGGYGTWVLNLDTWDLQWSDGVFILHGRPISAGVPTGDEAATYYSEETRNQMRHLIRHAMREQAGFRFTFDLTREDGETRRVVTSGHFSRHMGRQYLVGIFRDINEEREASTEAARGPSALIPLGA